MIKKIARLVRFLILVFVWTLLFWSVARFVMKLIWRFDIFSMKQWSVIVDYWNNNGVIAGISDFSFFIVLLMVFVLWLYGIHKVNKINYINMLIKPIEYINNRSMKKYEKNDVHVVIKNISVGEKISIEDVIKDRIRQEKNIVAKDAEALRKSISEKIIQRKEQ
jgi:hypothetical protein